MQKAFTAKRLVDGERVLDQPLVLVEDGRITSISTRSATETPAGAELIDFGAATLSPAFFDVHIHGAAGHDVMEATSHALETVGGFLASRGTGSYLATTVTASLDATLRSLSGLAGLLSKTSGDGTAKPVGIHLEGPFLSHSKRGVHPPEKLLAPDIGIFDQMYEAAEGHVKLMTLAPELPGAAELARHATVRGVRVSMGHSNANAEEARAVIAAGATSATHTFNAMRPLDHREPGILGVVLTTEALYAELICDGIHTAPELVRLWWSAKGPKRGILITDGMSAAGMADGTYDLGGLQVQVAEGKAMLNGVLAGSVLTLDRALTNFVHFTGATVEEGLRLLTANPASMTGADHGVGSLAVGQSADLVAVGGKGELLASIVGGRQAKQ